MNIPDYQEIKEIPLFSGISKEEYPVMLGCVGCQKVHYEKDTVIFLEEETIRHVGIVLSGAVHMIKEDIWGNKTILVHIRAGELFGETFICSHAEQSKVTFMTAEPSEILFLPFYRILHTCSHSCMHHQKLMDNMITLIANKNLQLIEKIEITSKKTLREKILCYLSIQSQKAGSMYFEIPLGRVALAEYLCADRSALTRELNRMKEEKIIDFDKNTFRILKRTV